MCAFLCVCVYTFLGGGHRDSSYPLICHPNVTSEAGHSGQVFQRGGMDTATQATSTASRGSGLESAAEGGTRAPRHKKQGHPICWPPHSHSDAYFDLVARTGRHTGEFNAADSQCKWPGAGSHCSRPMPRGRWLSRSREGQGTGMGLPYGMHLPGLGSGGTMPNYHCFFSQVFSRSRTGPGQGWEHSSALDRLSTAGTPPAILAPAVQTGMGLEAA